jgi:4-aminobutyrate aminotransferase
MNAGQISEVKETLPGPQAQEVGGTEPPGGVAVAATGVPPGGEARVRVHGGGRGRPPVSGLHGRHRRLRHGPLPPARGAGDPGAGGATGSISAAPTSTTRSTSPSSERLAAIAPGDEPKRVFLGNSGAEAVEAALKLARHHTGRPYAIAFFGAFHGRTMGAVSLTASKPVYHRGFAPLLPGIVHVPYGYCYRCAYNLTYPSCNLACVDFIEQTLMGKSIPPDEVAAIFVEPVQGEGGYVVPPDGWMQKLRALCDRYGILLVADEVQSGMGRTGKWFATEHWGVVPDILCVAKALASGMPVSAMVARESVMTWPVGAHGSTFGGNPVACAAALATIDVIEQEGLMENAVRVGNRLLDGLRALAREVERAGRPPFIGDVRGLGLMIGVELVQDLQTRAPAHDEAEAVMRECFRRGLLVLTCGASSIRFAPPLVITEAEADRALAMFADALRAVGR